MSTESDHTEDDLSNSHPNSHPHPEFPLTWELGEHGIDTFSIAWRPKFEKTEALLAAMSKGIADPATGKKRHRVRRANDSQWLSGSVNGVQVGCFPLDNVIAVEARLAAALAQSEEATTLAPPHELLQGVKAALSVLDLLTVKPQALAVLRRVDLTGEILFPDPSHGSVFLRAFAGAVSPPRYKSDVIWSTDNTRVETAYWRTPTRGVAKGRFYDAGVKHKTHLPGQRLRLEHQIRFPKAKQHPVEFFLSKDLGKLFCGALNTWIDRSESVLVMSPPDAIQYVLSQAQKGKLSAARAERIIGTLTVLSQGAEATIWTPRQHSDRVSELRGMEIALELGSTPATQVVEVHKPLEAMRAAWQ